MATNVSRATRGGRKRIPALAKRNKINLLKIPLTIRTFGSYRFLSELGPKGEGAIQIVKPLLKRKGGRSRYKRWSFLAAVEWLKRRTSKAAVAMAIDGLESSESQRFDPTVSSSYSQFVHALKGRYAESLIETAAITEDSHGDFPLQDIVNGEIFSDGEKSGSRKMFHTYGSRKEIAEVMQNGVLPLSCLLVKTNGVEGLGEDKYSFVVPYKERDKGIMLCEIRPQRLVLEDKCGIAFFRWVLLSSRTNSDDYYMNNVQIKKYSVLLPLVADYEGSLGVIYYLITYCWREMLRDQSIGKYRLTARTAAQSP